MAVFLLTLGCPKNQADSEHLAGRFSASGIELSDEPSHASVILVNTCGFIEEAKRESIEEILRLSGLRGKGGRLAVMGCLSERYGMKLMEEMPEIDAVFGVGEEDRVLQYCADSSASDVSPAALKPARDVPSYAYLKIAEGCSRRCTFCVIPSIRGPFRALPPEVVLKEAEERVSSGVREIVLVAQDLTAYSFKGYGLSRLIAEIASIGGSFRVRLLYLNPAYVDEGLIEAVASAEKVEKYFDMPLQHSEDRILGLMGRRGTKKEHLRLINRIRRIVPGAALRTTFMVGFPGETEEDFRGLVDFAQEAAFESMGAFKYSKEEGTPAARLGGHVPAGLKNRRFDELMRLQSRISLERNEGFLGRRLTALVDETDGGISIGRIYSQAPEVDGVTIIEGNGLKKGDFVRVEITGAMDYDLRAVVSAP